MPWRSTLRNVTLPLEIQGMAPDVAEQHAREMLHLVGLEDFATALPRDLSGGMRQRVALARALVHDPEVLLLDEPFGALDALTRRTMRRWLLGVWGRFRQAVILVTHDVDEAIYLSDRVYVFAERPGRILDEVPIDLPRPRDEYDDAALAPYRARLLTALGL